MNKNTTPISNIIDLFGIASPPENDVVSPEPKLEDMIPPNLHSQILIIPNFIQDLDCKFLVDYASKQPELTLGTTDGSSVVVDKKIRNTTTVQFDGEVGGGIIDLMKSTVINCVNPAYKVEVKSMEMPQLLKYEIGGHYDTHVDGEVKIGKNEWKKVNGRDISIILYLNDDFGGGELVFPHQHITIKPQAGMLVVFPSNHYFAHSVTPVTKGTRYSIVSWASLEDLETTE